MENFSELQAILDDESKEKKEESTEEIVIEDFEPIKLEDDEPKEEVPAEEPVVEALEEEAPAEEPKVEVKPEPVQTPQEILDELNRIKSVLGAHYQKMVGIINFHKTKDESISKLSATTKNYREGHSKQIFKAIINPIIRFREDCKKSLEDIKVYDLELDKIKKYIKYLDMDYEELLSGIGIEESGDEFEYNGHPLKEYVKNVKMVNFPETDFDNTVPTLPEMEINSVQTLCDYIVASEECLRQIVAFNDAKDKNIKNYIAYAENVEADYAVNRLYPVLNQMVSLKKKIAYLVKQKLEIIDDENDQILYEELLLFMINNLEAVLKACDVLVEKSVSADLDTQKDQIVKVIKLAEDDPQKDQLDRKIAARHTDCYILDGKVVYQSKVDVYKK